MIKAIGFLGKCLCIICEPQASDKPVEKEKARCKVSRRA